MGRTPISFFVCCGEFQPVAYVYSGPFALFFPDRQECPIQLIRISTYSFLASVKDKQPMPGLENSQAITFLWLDFKDVPWATVANQMD